MKHWYLIPLAAIIGLIAGSWGDSEECAKLQELGERAEKQQRTHDAGFGAIAQLARIPSRTKSVRYSQSVTNPPPSTVADSAPADTNAPSPKMRRRMSMDDLRARIDEAAELWRTRTDLAKGQWRSKLGMDDAAYERFESALEQMNCDLREQMVSLAEIVAEQRQVTPELGIRMMNTFSTALVDAYDAVGECVEGDRAAELSDMPIYEFIDPSVFEPMIQVQDYLESAGPQP